MDFVKVEDYSLFPWPERLWFVAVFLVAAVVAARLRPAWLPRLWLGAWLLAVVATLLSISPHGLRYQRFPILAEVVLLSGIPTGLTALWLARTRGHRLLGTAAAQGAGAVAAYLCGIVAAGLIVMAIWAAPGPPAT